MGTLSAAWLRITTNDGGEADETAQAGTSYQTVTNNIDLRWAGINMWKNASLELGANIFVPSLTDDQEAAGIADEVGVMLTAEYTQGGILGGFNKFAVQYATEGAAQQLVSNHSGSYYGLWVSKDADAYRLIDWGVIQLSDKVEMGYNAIYASAEFNGSDHKWLSVGVRPVYKWNDTQKTILEIGHDDTETWGGSEESLTKVTVAQAWTAGSSFWARPEIRAYVTDAISDNDTKFGDSDTNTSFGVQAEAWW